MTLLKSIAPALLLLFVFSGAAVAATGGHNTDGSKAPQQVSPTPEQQAQFQKMHDEYMGKVMPLHNQLEGKCLELQALRGVNGVSKEDVSALVREITGLKTKLSEERVAFSRSLDKAGLPAYRGYHGYHDGMGGMGMGGMGGCSGARADAGPASGGCMNGGMRGGMHGGMMPGGMDGTGPHHGDR